MTKACNESEQSRYNESTRTWDRDVDDVLYAFCHDLVYGFLFMLFQ